MAIDTTKNAHDLKLKLPVKVKSGVHLLSTSNESLCQESPITINEPVQELTVSLPARSLNTYIFMIEKEETAIRELKSEDSQSSHTEYFDLQGRRMTVPRGMYIEKRSDGTSRKVFLGR